MRLLEPLHCVRLDTENPPSCAIVPLFLFFCIIVDMSICAFRIGGTGGWSSKGCEVLERNNSHISCQCNHMTSFAVLMDVSKREVARSHGHGLEHRGNLLSLSLFSQHGDVLPLKIVTYATVSVSLFLLLLTLILLCLLRRLRSNLHVIHRNLVAALFFSELVFLLGINQTDNPVRGNVSLLLLFNFIFFTGS